MVSCLKFRSVLLIINQFIIEQLAGTILLISVNSACTIYQSCVYFHSVVTKIDHLLYERSVVRIFIQLWLKSINCVYFNFYHFRISSVPGILLFTKKRGLRQWKMPKNQGVSHSKLIIGYLFLTFTCRYENLRKVPPFLMKSRIWRFVRVAVL